MDLCPEALNDVNSQKLHIEVDKLDKLSFYNILSLMRNKLAMGIVTPPKQLEPYAIIWKHMHSPI